MPLPTLRKGYFWEIIGLSLLLGTPLAIELGFGCDPFENCDTRIGGHLGALLVVAPFFSFLLGGGLYVVGVAHVFMAPVAQPRKLVALVLPLLLVGLTLVGLVGVWAQP